MRNAGWLTVNALAAAFWLAACGGGSSGNTSDIPDSCNPLGGGTACLLPWPSSVYLSPDASTETGFRVALPPGAMPVNMDGIAVDPTPWNRFDGFSPSGALLAAFPQGVAPDGLPGHDDPAASLADDSLIVLVNMDTGERVPLFAEVDMNADDDAHRALIIRPLVRMAPASHYAVGIRTGVMGGDGQPLAPSPAFQALVDGTDFDHPLFPALAAGAGDLFGALDQAGVARDDLVLAWDFWTASDDSLSADLQSMREQALPVMGDAGENLTFQAQQVDGDPSLTYRLLVGTHDAPNFMTDGESDTSIIERDAGGAPVLDGTYDANFAAAIPACVTEPDAPLPIPLVVFGHGLFGSSKGYVTDDFLQRIANDNCVAVVAGDFIGLTDRQITLAALSANDLNHSHALVDKLGQAIINFIALERIARGPMATSPQFELDDGTPIIDPTRVYYLGGSLGGIMGGTFMAYDPTILRGALGVPGGDWSMLIERSYAWKPLQVAARGAYPDEYDYELLVSLLAWSMERFDPITTATHVLADPLPGTPAKHLLLYEAMNDCLVTNLSTETLARTMGLELTAPSVKQPYGLPLADGPLSDGLTVYDEHRDPPVPTTNVPPSQDNGTHSGVNQRPAVLREVIEFLEQGDIVNPCHDAGDNPVACDCATGACD